MGSWSMSKCEKASIIIPVLLRCWLKPFHVRPLYLAGLRRELLTQDPMGKLTPTDAIVFGFAKLAKSNALISAFELSDKDCSTFHHQIFDARRWVLLLMNAAVNKSAGRTKAPKNIRKGKHPTNKRQNALPPDPAPTTSGDDTKTSGIGLGNDLLDTNNALGGDADHATKLSSFSNFHIGVHFERLLKEYAVLWNTNVLFREDKHWFFKKTVFSTNHRKPERQLLLKETINFTIKAALNGAFLHTNRKITLQLYCVQKHCPNLFKEYVSYLKADSDNDNDANNIEYTKSAVAATVHHVQLAARGRLKNPYLRRVNLSSKLDEVYHHGFRELMCPAMDAYVPNVSHLGKKPLHWYEGFSFTSAATSKRVTFHIGEYVKLTSGEFALIRQIYTHTFRFENV